VALWLQRNHQADALFFWNQAKVFADAVHRMPIQSAPLLHYYSFMNATKALLSAKGVQADPHHGIRSHTMRGTSHTIDLSNEGVSILRRGVLPALSAYLAEAETDLRHSLEELLFNIPWVHRTFCLTYPSQAELFIPLTDCRYEFDQATGSAYLKANLSKDFADQAFVNVLPQSLVADPAGTDIRAIRSASSAHISSATVAIAADVAAITALHRLLRPDLNYINGTQTLWYAKAVVQGIKRLTRSPLTLTLAAMHRLSEICRYRPMELAAFLGGDKNWLITEFVQMSAQQFVDEISAEITGHQFMAPNVRIPT
jgi:hypothetical protein